MVYLDLVLNLSLLVALSIVSGFLEKHWPRRTFLGQFLQGILFGSVAVIGMLRPLNLGEGLIFDGRSIMVSLCALFFGPLASAVAGVMSIGCRLYLGGIGMITGCLVILSSLGIGLAARRFFQPETTPPSALRLYLFGLAVHLAMLFMMFTLPLAAALTILGRIGIPVLLLYPIATVLAGKILSDQVEAKRNMESLRQSEEKYRGLFNESITAVYVFDSNKNFVDVNEAGLNLLGYSREELLHMSIPDVDVNSTVVMPAHEQLLSGERLINYEHKLRRKDGKVVHVLNNSKPIIDEAGQVVGMQSTLIDITNLKQAEEALLESEERFKLAMEFANDGLFDWNLETDEIYYSPGWKRILGYADHEIPNEFSEWERLTEPEAVKESWKMLNELLEGKRDRFENEFRMRHKDGHWVDILSRANVIFDETGKGLRVVGTHVDITDRKIAEEALQKSEEQYRLVFEGADVLVSVYDRNGVCQLMNIKCAGLFGSKASDLQGKSFEELHPSNGEEYTKRVRDVIDSGTSRDFEDEVVFPTGSRWLLSRVQPVRDANGQINAAQIISQDITKRKQAEEALRKSEEKFSEFFFSSPTWLGFTRLDDGTFLEVNYAFERISGFSREETIGRTSLEIGLWGDTEKRERLINKARQTGRLREEEVVFCTKGGEPLPALWSAVVVEVDKEYCLLSTVMDISELKKAEKEKESLHKQLQQTHKMEAIGSLAGGIAHEFNNVLAIILGNAELAMDDVPDWNPAKESLKEIRKASFRAKEVVRQILSFARKTITALKPLEINTLVKESLKLMRASIPTMVDIRPNIPSEPKTILGDPTEIHQIVINLCTNAAHAMKASGGTLEVGISEVALDERTASRYEDLSAGYFVKLSVKDSGEGISPDILEKVFEPYFTTKDFGAGSGMGLAVVYGIVKKCKGAINITSTVGEGTTVEVLFPKIDEEAPPKEKKEGELPTGNEKMLLVDDDPSIVTMITQMLERLGYAVSGMTDSTQALEQFKSTPDDFDLVITDMAMPKMSGDQLAAELLNVRKDIPILLCTGHSDTVDEKKARGIGIKGFAIKPLDMGKLARAVRAALDG